MELGQWVIQHGLPGALLVVVGGLVIGMWVLWNEQKRLTQRHEALFDRQQAIIEALLEGDRATAQSAIRISTMPTDRPAREIEFPRSG